MLREQLLLGLDPDPALGRRHPALDDGLLIRSPEELPELPLRIGVDADRRWCGERGLGIARGCVGDAASS